MLFVNLPVTDLDAARSFYRALGFGIHERFSDEGSAALIVSDEVVVMLHTRDRFAELVPGEVGDPAKATTVVHRLVVDAREDVDDRVGKALAAAISGAKLVELQGRSHLPAIGDAQAVVDEVRRFLGLPTLRRAVPTGLTPRQAEVAALVAEGLTNRQLADRLGISERSAESHLERIRLRLGFSSRSQVAAWYVARNP